MENEKKTQAPEAAAPASEENSKPKKEKDGGRIFMRIVLIAALAVLVTIGGLWFSGLRYKKMSDGNGTTVKFFGWVDDNGDIHSGTLYYSGKNSGTEIGRAHV